MRRTTTCQHSAAHTDPIDRCTASLPPLRASFGPSLLSLLLLLRYITPWLLQKMNEYYLSHGVQLLDALDIHYYPNVPSDESSQANQAQFTDQVRSFYDPTYPDPGWIGPTGCGSGCNGPYVWLIPRFQQWIAQYAPNLTLPVAISEYSFGPDDLFSAALANAELLAVMGVHRVAYASRWVSPTAGTNAETAFKLYLNYDGEGSKIAGSSVPTSSSTAYSLTAYAVYNASTQSMFVLLFNLAFSSDSDVSLTVSSASLAGAAASVTAAVWQMSAASTALTAQAPVSLAANGASGQLSLSGYAVPARSATLLVIKGVTQSSAPAAAPSPFSSSSSSSSSSSAAPTSLSASAAVAATSVSATATASLSSSLPPSSSGSLSSSSSSSSSSFAASLSSSLDAAFSSSSSSSPSSSASSSSSSSAAAVRVTSNGAVPSFAPQLWTTALSAALTVVLACIAAARQ